MGIRGFAPLVTIAIAGLSATAHADGLAASDDPHAIVGGAPVASCGWPSTVWVDGCTATLVHPRMVVLASHCIVLGGTPVNASFGEQIDAPVRQVPIEGCVTYPNWQPTMPGDGNDDIAICELAAAVEDVPIVPILMGCEADALVPDATVTLVGFGVHDEVGSLGTKYAADVPVQMLGTDAIFVGDASASSCNGDSGGPAFVRLDDGSWRVFGVTSGAASTQPGCPQTAVYTLIHRYVGWIEDTSGLDVTPCHDQDGAWDPDERCTHFPLSPAQGGAQWNEGCDDGEHSGPAASCGPPIEEGGSSSSSEGGAGSSEGGVVDESSSTSSSESSGSADGTTSAATSSEDTSGAPASDDAAEGGGCGSCSTAHGHTPPSPLFALGLGVLVLAPRSRRACAARIMPPWNSPGSRTCSGRRRWP